jgi:hypothetical protein
MYSLPQFYLAIALAGFGSYSLVFSQNSGTTTADAELVANLGHSEFNVREQAAIRLLELGPQAIETLKNLPPGLSKEARNRAATIQEVLEQKSLKEISKSFLADVNDNNTHGLPGWQAFRDLVGGNRNSKVLFLELLKAHSEIASQIEQIAELRRIDQTTVDQETQLALHCAMRSSQLLDKLHRRGGLEIGDSVAMLFAASSIDGTVPFEVSELIRSTSQLGFAGSINRPGYRSCLLALLGRWIPKSPESMAPDVMQLARMLDLKQVLPISRRHISKTFDPFTREQAILCLVKFGDSSDAVELLKYADDNTVIYQFVDMSNDNNPIIESSVPPPGTTPNSGLTTLPLQKLVRVNDLAVAAAMTLRKEDPRQVFPNFTPESFSKGLQAAISVLETEQKSRDDAIHTWVAQQTKVAAAEPPLLAPVPDEVP